MLIPGEEANVKISEMVKEAVESGVPPIQLDFAPVCFFGEKQSALRTLLTVNSLDLGVLGYGQYRFVARRTRQGDHLVKRHLEKLFRAIPGLLVAHPEVACFTVPVYARLLKAGVLASMLVETFTLFPEVPVHAVCIELSADILYEDLEEARIRLAELQDLGVKIAICEVGDEFCPVFRLSGLPFDYAFLDTYATASLDGPDAERIAGSLVNYLHYMNVRVVAPGLDTEEKIIGAERVGCDGYTRSEGGGEVITGEVIADATV